MGVETEEIVELIAQRVPPGDKWELVIDRGNTVDGLVQTLTTYMRKTKFKGHYRLEPLNGKLFAIRVSYGYECCNSYIKGKRVPDYPRT